MRERSVSYRACFRNVSLSDVVSPLLQSELFAQLFGDPSLQQDFATECQLQRWLAFESALTQAQAETGHLDTALAATAVSRMQSFHADVPAIAAATVDDGLPIPEFVRQLKAHADDAVSAVHVGATSQDLLDTAFAQALVASADIIGILVERECSWHYRSLLAIG